MRIFGVKTLLRVMCLIPVVIISSLLITVIFLYFVVVVDIFVNTEKLSKLNPSLNAYCEKIALNPKFTKSPVVYRVDKGTLFFKLHSFVGNGFNLAGYAPFFIFPHHRTVILTEEMLKMDSITFKTMLAHELGHIQGGLEHFGPAKEMEKYANDFAAEIVKTQPQK